MGIEIEITCGERVFRYLLHSMEALLVLHPYSYPLFEVEQRIASHAASARVDNHKQAAALYSMVDLSPSTASHSTSQEVMYPFFRRILGLGPRPVATPRVFSNTNFEHIGHDYIFEETYADCLAERYYPVHIGEVFATGIKSSGSSDTVPCRPFGSRRISRTYWSLKSSDRH